MGRFMESHDRRVREEAFHTLYSAYARLENTLAASLSASVKRMFSMPGCANIPRPVMPLCSRTMWMYRFMTA